MHSLTSLEGFTYFSSGSSDLPCSYLYEVTQLGCDQVSDKFQIARDSSYKYHVLHYIYEGSGILQVNNIHYRLKAGDCFLLGPGKPHFYASDEANHLKMIWVEFYGSSTTELMNILFHKNLHLIHPPYTNSIYEALLKLLHTIKCVSPPNIFDLSKKLYDVLLSTIENGLLQNDHPSDQHLELPVPVQQALYYIEQHLTTTIKISTLASYVNCSTPYFSKLFSNTIGISPYKYILIKKIEYAVPLLANDQVTATQLASDLGFVDATHFSKVFKKITGQSIRTFKTSM